METIKKIVEECFGLDLNVNSRELKYIEARACFYWNGVGDQDGIDCLIKAFKYSENKKDSVLFNALL